MKCLKDMTTISVSTLLLLLFTAAGVYWVVSYHYQDILREKDESYWENLGRRQTHDLHCESQCKRMIDSTNILLSAYEDRLKKLTHTDVQSIQMKEESQKQVLNLYKSHAVFVSEQKQSTTALQCTNYCQELIDQLKACNESLERQTDMNQQLKQKRNRQQHSMVYMHKLLQECKTEHDSTYASWTAGVLVTGGILVVVWYGMAKAATQKRLQEGAKTVCENIPCPAVTVVSGSQEQLQRKLDEETKVQIDQLRQELTTAEHQLFTVQRAYEAEQKERAQLEESLTKREEEIKEKVRQSQNTMKFLENQRDQEQAAFGAFKQEIESKIQQREKQALKLAKENATLEKELIARGDHAIKVEIDLKQQKKENRILHGHIEVLKKEITKLEARRTKMNEKLLQKEATLKRKVEATDKLQAQLLKQSELLEQKTKEMRSLQEVYDELKMDIADYNTRDMMRLHELERETQRKDRALKGHTYREDRIGQLEKLLEERGRKTTSKKGRKPDDSQEQIRLEVWREFEEEYKRFETRIHGEHATLAEEISRLKTENKEQIITVEKLRAQNKTLEELLNNQHAQEKVTRRQEATDKANERMCRLTLDLYHPSLSPPSPTTSKLFRTGLSLPQ